MTCNHSKDLYSSDGKFQGTWIVAKHHTGRRVVICGVCKRFYGFMGEYDKGRRKLEASGYGAVETA